MDNVNKDEIQAASPWGILGSWICVPLDATREDIIIAAKQMAIIDFSDEFVADRLYGGFRCPDCEDKRHIYINSGQFTYLGENFMLMPGKRNATWHELISANQNNDGGFIGGGLFTEDVPDHD